MKVIVLVVRNQQDKFLLRKKGIAKASSKIYAMGLSFIRGGTGKLRILVYD